MKVKYFIEVNGVTRIGEVQVSTVLELNLLNQVADRTEYLLTTELQEEKGK